MKSINRAFILTFLLSSFLLSLYLIFKALKSEKWEVIAASLAVITAVIASYISLKVIWKQEDDLEPEIIVYFDLDSRSGAIQLIVKNIGGSSAYDVKIIWNKPLINNRKEEVNFPFIPVLVKNDLYRTYVGPSVIIFEEAKENSIELLFSGYTEYKKGRNKKSYTAQEFDLSLEPHRKKLRPFNDKQEFYLRNASLSSKLEDIRDALREISSKSDPSNSS